MDSYQCLLGQHGDNSWMFGNVEMTGLEMMTERVGDVTDQRTGITFVALPLLGTRGGGDLSMFVGNVSVKIPPWQEFVAILAFNNRV